MERSLSVGTKFRDMGVCNLIILIIISCVLAVVDCIAVIRMKKEVDKIVKEKFELIESKEHLNAQNKILSSDLILAEDKNRQLQDEINRLKGEKK